MRTHPIGLFWAGILVIITSLALLIAHPIPQCLLVVMGVMLIAVSVILAEMVATREAIERNTQVFRERFFEDRRKEIG